MKGMKTSLEDESSKGFTLIELIVVIAVLAIIAAVAFPTLIGLKDVAQERICFTNRKTVERMYSVYLIDKEHSDTVFKQFINENFSDICSCRGSISYENGKVNCSIHIEESIKEEVPWL